MIRTNFMMSEIRETISEQGITLYEFLEDSQVPQLSIQVQNNTNQLQIQAGDISRLAIDNQLQTSQINELYALNNSNITKINSLEDQVNSLQGDVVRLLRIEDQVQENTSELAVVKNKITNVENQITLIKIDITELNNSRLFLQNQINNIRDEQTEHTTKLIDLEREVSTLKNNLELVQDNSLKLLNRIETIENNFSFLNKNARIVPNTQYILTAVEDLHTIFEVIFLSQISYSGTPTMVRWRNYQSGNSFTPGVWIFDIPTQLAPVNPQANTYSLMTGTPYRIFISPIGDKIVILTPWKPE